MPVNENYKVVNVAEEEKEYGSILNFYKRLIAFYKSEEYNEILTYGDFRPIYEKEDHCCSSGSCCDFGGDCDYLCPGTDTGTDLTGKEAGHCL